ncbi:MAG: hypothetical protein ABL899_03275 [Nitrospira sp.]
MKKYLFKNYYEPKLLEQGVDNIVLRTYTHIKGFSTDDPNNSTELIFTPQKEVSRRINDIFSKTKLEKGVAITSIVSFKTSQKFLFLLDCGISVSDKNEKELISIIKKSKKKMKGLKRAMVLRTLNSYHVVGFVPLSFEEWQNHMAEAILLRNKKGESVGDIRYIGHSLERGYGSLRLSDYLGKPTPEFVCYI